MKIAVFGGAFNPVHNGHINLAKQYISLLEPDKLLIIPTANPPHKADTDFVSETHRLNMLECAFRGNRAVEISDIEFKMTGKSYTYNTIKEIKRLYKDAELYLIIGEDQLLYFNKWYKYQEILDCATICTAQRNYNKAREMKAFAENVLHCKRYIIADFDPIVVSSSEVREKLKNKEKVNDLIPDAVLNYIEENGLYGR